MVFQEYALFPWMTVEANVAFGLEIKGGRSAAIRARVDELLRHARACRISATATRRTSPAACASASPSPACSPSIRP